MPKVIGSTGIPYTDGVSRFCPNEMVWVAPVAAVSDVSLAYSAIVPVDNNKVIAWDAGATADAEHNLAWSRPTPSQCESKITWGYCDPVDYNHRLYFGNLYPVDQNNRLVWLANQAIQDQRATTWGRLGYTQVEASTGWNPSTAFDYTRKLTWGYASRQLSVSYKTLAYNQEKVWETYSIERYLILLPEATVTRISGSVDIPVTQVTMSAQKGSWTWAMSAEVAKKSDIDLLQPQSGVVQEVDVTINGYTWRCYVEKVSRSYGQTSNAYQISGRSLTAYLSDTYSALGSKTTAVPYLASQLANQEVTGDGYTIDWQIPDWTIPAGSFSYQNLSPLGAVRKLVNGVGATLIPTLNTNTLTVKNFLSVDPRDLGTKVPAQSIDQSVIYTLSEEYRQEPLSDRVWCHGTDSNAVMVRGTLSNKDGSNVAATFSDQVIVDETAGRIAAQNILFAGGRWNDVSFTAPCDTGSVDLFQIGDIAEVIHHDDTYLGFVSGVSVNASGGYSMSVVQTVKLEAWLGE